MSNLSALSHLILALSFALSLHAFSQLHTSSQYAVKDNHPVPYGWNIVTKPSRNQRVTLQIGLKHGRFDELARHLYEGTLVSPCNENDIGLADPRTALIVSDPGHSRYGQHLSADDVAALAEPTAQTNELVRHWLMDYGVREITYSSMRDWMTVDVSIDIAERLLNTEYHIFRHIDHGTTLLRAPSWSLPMHLHEHIEAIHPTNAFFHTSTRSKRLQSRSEAPPDGLGQNGVPTFEDLMKIDRTEMGHMDIPDIDHLPENPNPSQACNWLATSPLCLRTMYGTLGYKTQAPGKVRIGLVNYLDQINNHSDIEIFLQRYRPDAVGASSNITTEIVAHGSNQQTPVTAEQGANTIGLEGNLNAETVLGLAFPLPVTTYNVGGQGPFHKSRFSTENHNEPYLTWLQYVLAQSDLPQVITTSYADEEQNIPYWYAKRACQGFAQLGARGVSVLFASGDEGVGADGKCFSNDGSDRPMFLPKFPASCPYVTAVGGTRNWNPEIAGFDARRTFVAGGGFSNYFPRPDYQNTVVGAYIDSLGSLHDGLYNKAGRGYPDISVRSYHYITVWNATARIIDGTSASSPAAAAIFSLVNDVLAAEDKSALGWLNPWIYSEGVRGFTDVVVGSIPGCNTSGFPARNGWDAATGFGTPVSAACDKSLQVDSY